MYIVYCQSQTTELFEWHKNEFRFCFYFKPWCSVMNVKGDLEILGLKQSMQAMLWEGPYGSNNHFDPTTDPTSVVMGSSRNCHGDLSHSKAHVRSYARLSSPPLISGIINQATNNSVKTQEINDPTLPTESHSVLILNPGGNECKGLR